MDSKYYKKLYDEKYYKHYDTCDYGNKEYWRPIFSKIADKIIEKFNPQTTLEMGCAYGYLVDELRKRGVEAYGIDISEHAIKSIDEKIQPYVYCMSALDDLPDYFPEKYDLVISIEMIEHLYEDDGLKVIDRMVSYSDKVLISSTDSDFDDPTHFNVKPREYWCDNFAKKHYYRELDEDYSFISQNTYLFEYKGEQYNKIIYNYERKLGIEEKNNDHLNIQLVELNKHNNLQNERMMQQDKEIAEMSTAIDELNKHNNLQNERMTQQEKEIIEMSTTIDELNKHNNMQHERMTQQEKEIIEMSTTIDELNKHNNLQHEKMVHQDKEIAEMSTTINELNKHNNLQHERMMQQEEELNKLYDSINKLKIKENEQNNIILGKEMENNVLNQQINENMKILDELKNKLDNTEKLLYKIENSKSWKITKPLRSIARKFKRGQEI